MSPCLSDPLGFRLDGRPFWGFSGAEDDDDKGGDDPDPDDDEKDDVVETDPVKKLQSTLDKVSSERRAARDELRPYKAVLRELGIQNADQLKERLGGKSGAGASGTGKQEQVDIEKVREDARREARLEANRDVALANVKAEAKGVFKDPEDAVEYLRKHVDDLLDRDGKPDPKAIKRELDDLLALKSHWGVEEGKDMSFDGGARQTAGSKQTMDSFLRQKSRERRG